MRPWKTVGILALCVAASAAAAWAVDDYRVCLDSARRPSGSALDAAGLQRAYAHLTPPNPVTERVRFARTLRVKTLAGEEVRLDFSRGKHIVLFAGCT